MFGKRSLTLRDLLISWKLSWPLQSLFCRLRKCFSFRTKNSLFSRNAFAVKSKSGNSTQIFGMLSSKMFIRLDRNISNNQRAHDLILSFLGSFSLIKICSTDNSLYETPQKGSQHRLELEPANSPPLPLVSFRMIPRSVWIVIAFHIIKEKKNWKHFAGKVLVAVSIITKYSKFKHKIYLQEYSTFPF